MDALKRRPSYDYPGYREQRLPDRQSGLHFRSGATCSIEQSADDDRQVKATFRQFVPCFFDCDDLCPRWDRRDTGLKFGDRAEWIRSAMNEDSRHPQAWKMLRAQFRRLPGWVERIGEQKERCSNFRFVSCQYA